MAGPWSARKAPCLPSGWNPGSATTIRFTRAKLHRRKEQIAESVEHPFGTIKCWIGHTHFQIKTLKRLGSGPPIAAMSAAQALAGFDLRPDPANSPPGTASPGP